jgi:hypothetical protein
MSLEATMSKSRKRARPQARTARSKAPRTASKRTARTRGATRILRRSTRREAALPETAARRATLARAAAETLRVTFDLTDVAGQPISDPETFFTFRRLQGNRQMGDQVAMALAGSSPAFNVPVDTDAVFFCEIDPRRFRFVTSPTFFGSPGPPIRKSAQLFREPTEWTPSFTKWDALPASFANLKELLTASPQITLFKGVAPIAEALVGDAYDNMAGEAVTLAKTALLNSHFRLSRTLEPVSGTRSWFSFVKRVIAIGRERFLAFVDPEMETLVRQVHTHIDQFRAEYERTPAENHRGNVPAALQPRITSMISIKSTHSKGNFQLTLTHLASPDEVLLDTDIDESGDLLEHFFDLFKHKLTGGTHPHDIHELLVLQEGGSPGFDLGYRLE